MLLQGRPDLLFTMKTTSDVLEILMRWNIPAWDKGTFLLEQSHIPVWIVTFLAAGPLLESIHGYGLSKLHMYIHVLIIFMIKFTLPPPHAEITYPKGIHLHHQIV